MIRKIDCHNAEVEAVYNCRTFVSALIHTSTVAITESFDATTMAHAQDEPRPTVCLYLNPEQARALADGILKALPPPEPKTCPECKREL